MRKILCLGIFGVSLGGAWVLASGSPLAPILGVPYEGVFVAYSMDRVSTEQKSSGSLLPPNKVAQQYVAQYQLTLQGYPDAKTMLQKMEQDISSQSYVYHSNIVILKNMLTLESNSLTVHSPIEGEGKTWSIPWQMESSAEKTEWILEPKVCLACYQSYIPEWLYGQILLVLPKLEPQNFRFVLGVIPDQHQKQSAFSITIKYEFTVNDIVALVDAYVREACQGDKEKALYAIGAKLDDFAKKCDNTQRKNIERAKTMIEYIIFRSEEEAEGESREWWEDFLPSTRFVIDKLGETVAFPLHAEILGVWQMVSPKASNHLSAMSLDFTVSVKGDNFTWWGGGMGFWTTK